MIATKNHVFLLTRNKHFHEQFWMQRSKTFSFLSAASRIHIFFQCTSFETNRDLLSCSIPKKELSKIPRTTRQKMIKVCKNLRQGNSNHHERFDGTRANISATKNDLKFVAIFG